MLPEDAKLISVDDHLIEPANTWTSRLPAKYQEHRTADRAAG